MNQLTRIASRKKIFQFGPGWVIYSLAPWDHTDLDFWNGLCDVYFTYHPPARIIEIENLNNSDSCVYLGLIELARQILEATPELCIAFFEEQLVNTWSEICLVESEITVQEAWVLNLWYLKDLEDFKLEHLLELGLTISTAYNVLNNYLYEEIINPLEVVKVLAEADGWNYTPLASVRHNFLSKSFLSIAKHTEKSWLINDKLRFLRTSYGALWFEFWEKQGVAPLEINQILPSLPRPDKQYVLLLRRHLVKIINLERVCRMLHSLDSKRLS